MSKLIILCETCGIEVEARRRTKRFCSDSCFYKQKKLENAAAQITSPAQKLCGVCFQVFSSDDFYRNPVAPDGLAHQCKACAKKVAKAYAQVNFEKRRKWGKDYRPIHEKKRLERYWADPEAARQKCRDRRARNPEPSRRASRKWGKSNPEKTRVQYQKRRAALLGVEGSYTAEEFRAKLEAYGGRCHWCFRKIGGVPHADHLIPLRPRGGDAPGTNWISNIVPSCGTCNSKKNNKRPWEFQEGRLL